jgi:phage terminase large subunit-like protein
MAGRGSGKTRSGAELVRKGVEEEGVRRIALVAPTQADVRDVMVEGESGLIGVCPDWNRPIYQSSKRRVLWPNGAAAYMYSSEEPHRLRGPQHEKAWCDEIVAWKQEDTWDMLQFGLRLGSDPQAVVTTTPFIGHRLIRRILHDEYTKITKGSTLENAENLAAGFIDQIIKKYKGTRLWGQEILGNFLEKMEGALWSDDWLRIDKLQLPELARVVVAIDPAASTGVESAETGIVVCGVDEAQRGYVLEDLSGSYSPNEWANIALDAYTRHRANIIIAEANHGGDMVESTIRQASKIVPFKKVFASRGKRTRAEPVAALYEQKRVYHTEIFDILEEQMLSFNPDKPVLGMDRVDALVWGLTELIVDAAEVRIRFL